MKQAELFHREAMETAERADLARLRGDGATHNTLIRKALILECQAADLMATTDLEPTRSVLHRSAATLALECNEPNLAAQLIEVALSGNPPGEIGEELRSLQKTVANRLRQRAKEIDPSKQSGHRAPAASPSKSAHAANYALAKLAISHAVEGRSPQLPELFAKHYATLRDIAMQIQAREKGPDLDPEALINEAFIRMVDLKPPHDSADDTFFRACFAQECRRILVDGARMRASKRRGGGKRLRRLRSEPAVEIAPAVDLIALNDALESLSKIDERMAKMVELRLFGGLSLMEAAAFLKVSERVAGADWHFARAWLRNKVGD